MRKMDTNRNKGGFYITTTLPYVNSDPHIGFAMEIIRADVIARHMARQGRDVFFNTGTDEHGQKLYEAAAKAGKDVKAYVDEYAEKFRELKAVLGLSDGIRFVRTTDAHHEKAAQEFWKRVADGGYIYKKNYAAKYCVGCEENKNDSELGPDGRCLIHPNRDIEVIEEENYFFRFSAFGDRLVDFYDSNPGFVVPEYRLNEMREFIKRGLEDFSISRLKRKMPWGIPVPGDEDHVMYVWFDALVNYVSTLGWPEDEESFRRYWAEGEPTQYCGKDNTRFQAVMWQSMLMAAGLPNSRRIVVDGFITSGGQKMSKSLGNVLSPVDIVNEYGTDALRYYVTRELHPFEDGDVTMEKFKDAYNGNLANGIGNLANRVMKMAETNLPGPVEVRDEGLPSDYRSALDGFDHQRAMHAVWERIGDADRMIQELQPFKLVKTEPEQGKAVISALVQQLHSIGVMLIPFMPATAEAILESVRTNKMPSKPLFMRKD